MTLTPLFTAGLETALNRVLYRDRSLKAARQRLSGNVLTFQLEELARTVTLVFSEQQVDVLADWQDQADCTVKTRLRVLPALRDNQQLTALIRRGDLVVEGDLQVITLFSSLIDLAELDPAEYLSPWIGDIFAQGICQMINKGSRFIRCDLQRKQEYLSQALTEEWRVAPGALELASFAEEVDALVRAETDLSSRLARMEVK